MYRLFVQRRHQACRLVISADAPFLPGASEADWRHGRDREASDVNVEVREAIGRDGCSLLKIGLSLSGIPQSDRDG